MDRKYLVIAFDITDLDDAEVTALTAEVWAQTDRSEGHRSVHVSGEAFVDSGEPLTDAHLSGALEVGLGL